MHKVAEGAVLVEEVVCVVEGIRAATGAYKVDEDAWAFNEYDLFFTDRRFIFAIVMSQRDWRASPKDETEAVTTAVGMLTEYGDAKRRRREQFRGKTPGEILGLHPDSFEIPYENVKSIKLSKLSITGTLSQGRLAGTLEISALWQGSEKKFKFSIPKKQFEEVKAVVDKYLHEKVMAK